MTPSSENYGELPGLDDKGWPNVIAKPDPNSLHRVAWAGNGKYSVGEVLCETKMSTDGSPQAQCPRFIASRQIDKLESLGYRLYSAFECEMMVCEAGCGKLLWDTRGFCTQLYMSRVEKLLLEVDELLIQSSVDVESYQIEYEPGQCEMPLRPKFGVCSADAAFILRNGLKEIYEQRGYQALFLTKPRAGAICNAFHFNHSLCSVQGDRNVFQGGSGESSSVSDTCRLWLAGLVKHSAALCALSAPTVNCYRRFHKPFAPHKSDWGMDNRLASYRVKSSQGSPPYIENRLPSSSCNPYLVLAGTVAAGLDGVLTGSQSPPERDPSAIDLPHTLEEALTALEKDTVMVKALGEDFIKWFVPLKRKMEIERLPDSDMGIDDQAAIDKEIALYGECI